MFFVDLHCDTITTCMDRKQNMISNNCQIDFERLNKFQNPVQIFSIWLNNKLLENPFQNTLNSISFFNEQIKNYNEHIDIAKNYKEIKNNIKNKKISAILGIEGGEALEGDIENLKYLYSKGIRVLTFTWNRENEIGFGIRTKSDKGLKEFGFEVIEFINKNNIIADVSHINEAGFWDIYKFSEKPFIASHSNCYEICKNPRNLNDKQLKAIAEKGGIIGINLYPPFLSNTENADYSDVILHIEHIIKIIGNDFIGLGCDFDGIDKNISNLHDVLNLYNLREIIADKYGYDTTEKIMNKNFMRLFKNIY